MYPFLRLAGAIAAARRAPPLPVTGVHRSRHLCWPWDLDLWAEMNNGRTLTLYDLGRIPLAMRTGMSAVLRRNGWGITVAGSTTRYRRRVRLFDRVEMRSRCIGWDARFFYIEQAMWRGAECTSHVLIRMAVTRQAAGGRGGIVAPAALLASMGRPADSPALPPWVAAWIAADGQRPWPPVIGDD